MTRATCHAQANVMKESFHFIEKALQMTIQQEATTS